jgi:hypothetical protein
MSAAQRAPRRLERGTLGRRQMVRSISHLLKRIEGASRGVRLFRKTHTRSVVALEDSFQTFQRIVDRSGQRRRHAGAGIEGAGRFCWS